MVDYYFLVKVTINNRYDAKLGRQITGELGTLPAEGRYTDFDEVIRLSKNRYVPFSYNIEKDEIKWIDPELCIFRKMPRQKFKSVQIEIRII